MSWWGWTLVGVGGLAVLLAIAEIPSTRRYLRMKRM